jgi:CheY-like chemotaxis protein
MGSRKKALIVDDEEDFLYVLGKRLDSAGFDVVAARTGQEALDIFDSARPDLVLLDVMMPGMGGLDVLRKIRARDKNLPVFIITAFQNEKRFALAGELNASGFIFKDSDLRTEIEKMKEILAIAEREERKNG